jgi:hypothetical protein
MSSNSILTLLLVLVTAVDAVALIMLRREQRKYRDELAALRANERLTIDVLDSSLTSKLAQSARMDALEQALLFMTRQPTCPQALGARVARLEMLLLPSAYDTDPVVLARGGAT